ncbi:MAG TPA: lytic transglycosylase domain-containing protein [Geminicoccaceae bacterium]|nr:lytic transglycosylase domain-containing protein [Geminicoccaceae bacterium]
MAPLKVVALAAVLASVPVRADAAVEQRLDRWTPYVAEASARFSLPSEWIRRVIRAESGGRTHVGGRPIVSRAGAMGLMQLMPATWAAMRARLGLGEDPHDPRDNILAGTAYLRLMYDRFGYPGLFGAYNAGPARYAAHLATGRPLPSETRAYLAAVAGAATPVPSPGPPARSELFVVRRGEGAASPAGSRAEPPAGGGLLVLDRLGRQR